MKTQKYNEGILRELNVSIEEEVLNTLERMSKNTGMPLADLVVIALKRYCASHSDYDNSAPPLI